MTFSPYRMATLYTTEPAPTLASAAWTRNKYLAKNSQSLDWSLAHQSVYLHKGSSHVRIVSIWANKLPSYLNCREIRSQRTQREQGKCNCHEAVEAKWKQKLGLGRIKDMKKTDTEEGGMELVAGGRSSRS